MDRVETIRRVRLGHLKKLFLHRYGPVLPDDDAGREDLVELLRLSADKNMIHVVEVCAPWLTTVEAEELIEQVKRLPVTARWSTPEELGERQRLTNRDRDRLGLWQIRPCDISEEELAEHRKAQDRARKRRKRVPRPVYEANSLSKTKPWEQEGISRRSWYRRHRKAGTGPSAINSSLERTHLCQGRSRRKCKAPPYPQSPRLSAGAQLQTGKTMTDDDLPKVRPDGHRIVAREHLSGDVEITLEYIEPGWITPDWESLSHDQRYTAIMQWRSERPSAGA